MGNGMLSQEEIDALLRGTMELGLGPGTGDTETSPTEDFLDEMEKDTLGEIANISMGTAATTLSQLLGKKVDITTPKVDLTTSEQIRKDYPIPSVICDVKYKAGIEGSNLLILSQRDGSVIVDLMMGGDGKNPTPELSELQISGISEAMNQMMGSAATSMSTMFNSMVDITPPNLVLNDLSHGKDVIQDFLPADEPLVRISFRMVVEDVIDSTLDSSDPTQCGQRDGQQVNERDGRWFLCSSGCTSRCLPATACTGILSNFTASQPPLMKHRLINADGISYQTASPMPTVEQAALSKPECRHPFNRPSLHRFNRDNRWYSRTT